MKIVVIIIIAIVTITITITTKTAMAYIIDATSNNVKIMANATVINSGSGPPILIRSGSSISLTGTVTYKTSATMTALTPISEQSEIKTIENLPGSTTYHLENGYYKVNLSPYGTQNDGILHLENVTIPIE